MYLPRRKSSLSHEVTVIADTDDVVGCYNCDRVDHGHIISNVNSNVNTKININNDGHPGGIRKRRRSSNSFKVGSYIDSLLSDRTSGHKSAPIEFGLEIMVSDFSYHEIKGGKPPKGPKRLNSNFLVQYVQWEGQHSGGIGVSQPPLVGHVDVSALFQYKEKQSDRSKGFAGFLIPYRLDLKLGITNTEGTRICVWIMPYDLTGLAKSFRRTVRYSSGPAVVQLTFFNTSNKFYVGGQMHIVLKEHQESVVGQWEIKTVGESHFDSETYWFCELCKGKIRDN